MSIRNRVNKLEEKSDTKFKVVITKGEFFDRKGNLISFEDGYPKNLLEDVHRAIVGVSDSDETEVLERKESETGAEFMRRFDKAGTRIGKSLGAAVTLSWDVKWL
ncbi:MAG: hypothetical protein AB3N07_06865 [Ruegeria sp.]